MLIKYKDEVLHESLKLATPHDPLRSEMLNFENNFETRHLSARYGHALLDIITIIIIYNNSNNNNDNKISHFHFSNIIHLLPIILFYFSLLPSEYMVGISELMDERDLILLEMLRSILDKVGFVVVAYDTVENADGPRHAQKLLSFLNCFLSMFKVLQK